MKKANVKLSDTAHMNLPIAANWESMNKGEAWGGTYEFPMYTDIRLTSELVKGCGPYSFFNALTLDERPGNVQAGFIFRCAIYGDTPGRIDILSTDDNHYHGGWLKDEVSALASLVLGARVRAGDVSRSFGVFNEDPMGIPRANLNAPPTVSMRGRRLIVPSITGARMLGDLTMLNMILKLSLAQKVALMRAARLYQDALWIIESEPELAWLMLVSSLEAGALNWDQEEKTSIEILQSARSDFADVLREKGGDILDIVANEVASLFKVTTKFQKFCLHFLPKPPVVRPREGLQIKWSKNNWQRIFKKVYSYRSRALHSGNPFPRPMCEAVDIHSPDTVPCEIGTPALAVQMYGAIWNKEDLPISLDMFAQVTRGILLGWWREIADVDDN